MRSPILLSTVVMTSAVFVSAQQTIFNVPTTDVLDRGEVYAELDASFKFNHQAAAGKFSSLVPRLVLGVGGRVEAGLNLTGNIQPGEDATTIVPTIKWKFFEDKKKNVAFIAGTNFYIPVTERTYNFGTWSYAEVSKIINKTRVTAGVYVASRNVFAPKAVRGGGQFGFEQTLNNKLTVAADWITGKHSAGYLTPGLIYKPHPRVTAYLSYSIGNANARQGNHFFLFELGYNFN